MNGPHKLVEPMTQEEADKLADLLWFVKGWLRADGTDCPFDHVHVEALSKARANVLPHVVD